MFTTYIRDETIMNVKNQKYRMCKKLSAQHNDTTTYRPMKFIGLIRSKESFLTYAVNIPLHLIRSASLSKTQDF